MVQNGDGRPTKLFPYAVSKEEGQVLYDLVRKTGAKKTLEIGFCYGLSSLFICQAHKDKGSGQHTVLDPWEKTKWESIGLLNIERAGLQEYLRFYEAPSHEALPQLLAQNEKFDFIFIDGVHLFDYTLVEFFYADKLLNPGGYLALDDLWMPSIRKTLSFILSNRHYRPAPDFHGAPYPLSRQCLRLARALLFGPLEARGLCHLFGQARYNYRILEKTADDDWQELDKKWTHYKPF